MMVPPSVTLTARKNAKEPTHSKNERIALRTELALRSRHRLVIVYASSDVTVVRKIVKINNTLKDIQRPDSK
jgi:hypothetical protein